jgi:hypothetical protein
MKWLGPSLILAGLPLAFIQAVVAVRDAAKRLERESRW